MAFTLGLAQTCHPEDGDVVSLVETTIIEAKKRDVELLIFPESLMSRYEQDLQAFVHEAQPLDGAFSTALDNLASRYHLWIVYTMNEFNPAGKPFNTAVLVDDQGKKRSVYRKVHLFDTDFTHESDRMCKGDELPIPVKTPFGTIALGICYDLRFPEFARLATLEGSDLIVYPAAWVDGPHKAEQWLSLLKARAIENELFVAGVSRADKGYIGSSALFDPMGCALIQADSEQGLLTAQVDLNAIKEIRDRMPVFDHRRRDLYNLNAL